LRLTTNLPQVLRLIKNGAITPLPPYTFVACPETLPSVAVLIWAGDNIKLELNGRAWSGVIWAFVNTVMNMQFHEVTGIY
jgi:hypothetical protein